MKLTVYFVQDESIMHAICMHPTDVIDKNNENATKVDKVVNSLSIVHNDVGESSALSQGC